MKTPATCRDMVEIRADVSALDHEILRMLGKRLEYVKAAVAFKPDEASITNPGHWDRFFADRRAWAVEAGYDPNVIEALFRSLYDYSIEVQLAMLRERRGA